MCEGVTSKTPASCPVCGMALIPADASEGMGEDQEMKSMWVRLMVAIPLSIIIVSLAMLPMVGVPLEAWISKPMSHGIQWLLATIVVFGCGLPFLQRGYQSILNRRGNMFTLIALGTLAAYGSSVASMFGIEWHSSGTHHVMSSVYFESCAVITALVLLGQVLEIQARNRTGQAIRELMNLTPERITVVRDGNEIDVTLENVVAHDIVRIRPGERVPVDGTIMEGECLIDESMLTGESMPVSKAIDDLVFAGTMLNNGACLAIANRVGRDTKLGQMVRLVSEAQRSRAPIQRFADRVSGYFVPIVIAVSIGTFLFWMVSQWEQPAFLFALMNAVAVLVIACPCALGLATPMSITVGIGRGSKDGILVRNAETMESLCGINSIAIDKTGTLTMGNPEVMEVFCRDEWKGERALQIAASLEHLSQHPLGKAIEREASGRGIPLQAASNFKSTHGSGIEGTVDGMHIEIHHREEPSIAKLVQQWQERGWTVVHLTVEGKHVAAFAIGDQIKANAKMVVELWKSMGISVTMLTGDRSATALAIAAHCGIDNIVAEATPASKLEWIQEASKSGAIAMIGDGINDAAALAAATVGIAMGTGTDIAMEAADVTLMSGDLEGVAKAIRLSQKTMANIRQNMFLAIAYNAIAIPIAAGLLYPISHSLLLSPMIAAGAMSLSSVSVIANALRLRNISLE